MTCNEVLCDIIRKNGEVINSEYIYHMRGLEEVSEEVLDRNNLLCKII